jgi:hypothetical protein
MKKKIFTFATAICIAMAAVVSTSCSDDDDNNQNALEEEMTETEPVDNTPTADAMTTKTDAKAYVVNGDFGNIGKKFIARISNRQSKIDRTTELIFLPAEKYATLSQEDKDSITVAYKHGAKILVDRPSTSEMMLMAFSIPDGSALSTVPESTPNDEAVEMWGFNLSSDVLGMDIPVNDSTDVSANNRAVLSDYEEGLFADEAAEWVNTDQNAVAQARMAGAATRANTDLNGILDAQTDTWIVSVSTDGFDELKDKQTPYTVFTTIYAVHKFSTDTDYYLIDQTLTGNNSTFWLGEWKKKDYKAKGDGGKYDWRVQGFYANNWELENFVSKEEGTNEVKLSDGLTLVKHAPLSTNASTTTSTSTSWNIGGNLGVTGSGPSIGLSGGISGSVGSSQTLMDISTVDKCMKGESFQNNAWWEYTIDPWRQKKEEWNGYEFVLPPKSSTETFMCEQSWLWELKNASQYDKLYLWTELNIELYRTLVRNPSIFKSQCRYECEDFCDYRPIKINLPNRKQ